MCWIDYVCLHKIHLKKFHPKLQLKMETDSQSGKYLVWIYFTDKGNES